MALPETILILTAVFFIGGIVKGVIGTGLPTVAVALLAVFFDVPTAIALLAAPAIATNILQAFRGGAFVKLVIRLAPFLIAIFCGVLAGLAVLSAAPDAFLIGVLGFILCCYAILGLMNVNPPSPGRFEGPASALVGLVNGTITGMTGTFVVPAVIYLRVLGFGRRELLQAMGITFLFSITALTLLLGVQAKIDGRLGLLSLYAVLPALCGQFAGTVIRDRLSEATFRTVFMIGLLVLGAHLLARATGLY